MGFNVKSDHVGLQSTNTSILKYFGVGNSFLTIDLKNNHDMNRKFKMAPLNLHIGEGNFGIL